MNILQNILRNVIVFEGLDGAGTTTQASYLSQNFRKAGRKILLTCEPTDSPIGRLIRQVLHGDVQTTPRSLALLFAADRENHIYNSIDGIELAVERNEIVISDRYFFSSLAYQSIDTPYDEVRSINSFFPFPEVIIYIDTPPDICIERIENRKDRDDFETLEFQEKVYNAYEQAFRNLPKGSHLLRFDGTLEKDILEKKIFSTVSQIISIASP
ncbi:MAG: dTMP kinase [Spirochaetales bacterium]|nr:dTMP kinase [Spirochaetales bacterium]